MTRTKAHFMTCKQTPSYVKRAIKREKDFGLGAGRSGITFVENKFGLREYCSVACKIFGLEDRDGRIWYSDELPVEDVPSIGSFLLGDYDEFDAAKVLISLPNDLKEIETSLKNGNWKEYNTDYVDEFSSDDEYNSNGATSSLASANKKKHGKKSKKNSAGSKNKKNRGGPPFPKMHKPTPLLLSCHNDGRNLPDVQCLARQNIEFVTVTDDDDMTFLNTYTFPSKIQGQIAIRCVLCADSTHEPPYPPDTLLKFPKSIEDLYDATMDIMNNHFRVCENLPKQILKIFTDNKKNKINNSDPIVKSQKEYYVNSAKYLGLCNGNGHILLKEGIDQPRSVQIKSYRPTSPISQSQNMISPDLDQDIDDKTLEVIHSVHLDPRTVVKLEDRTKVADFNYVLLGQLISCGKPNPTTTTQKGLSLLCKHCSKEFSFVSCSNFIKYIVTNVRSHIRSCRKVPRENELALDELTTLSKRQRIARLGMDGKLTPFYDSLWGKLCVSKGDSLLFDEGDDCLSVSDRDKVSQNDQEGNSNCLNKKQRKKNKKKKSAKTHSTDDEDINDYDNHIVQKQLTIANSVTSVLVKMRDREITNDFIYLTFMQVTLTPSNKPEVVLFCRHCTKKSFSFKDRKEIQKHSVQKINKHLQSCIDCPTELKDALAILSERASVEQASKSKHGGIKNTFRTFYRRVWRRVTQKKRVVASCHRSHHDQGYENESSGSDGDEYQSVSINSVKSSSLEDEAGNENLMSSVSGEERLQSMSATGGKKRKRYDNETQDTSNIVNPEKFAFEQRKHNTWFCKNCITVPITLRGKNSVLYSPEAAPPVSSMKSHQKHCRGKIANLGPLSQAFVGMTRSFSGVGVDTLIHPQFVTIVKSLLGGREEYVKLFTERVRDVLLEENWANDSRKSLCSVDFESEAPAELHTEKKDLLKSLSDFARLGLDGVWFDFVDDDSFVRFAQLVSPGCVLPSRDELMAFW